VRARDEGARSHGETSVPGRPTDSAIAERNKNETNEKRTFSVVGWRVYSKNTYESRGPLAQMYAKRYGQHLRSRYADERPVIVSRRNQRAHSSASRRSRRTIFGGRPTVPLGKPGTKFARPHLHGRQSARSDIFFLNVRFYGRHRIEYATRVDDDDNVLTTDGRTHARMGPRDPRGISSFRRVFRTRGPRIRPCFVELFRVVSPVYASSSSSILQQLQHK